MAQQVVVTDDSEAGTVTTLMVVKADSAEEAAHVATRVAEAAHREAGHGLLLRRIRRSAVPHRRPAAALSQDGRCGARRSAVLYQRRQSRERLRAARARR